MKSVDGIWIAAPPEIVFPMAAAVERWPEILPHYREVRVLSGDALDREVFMSCVREFGPLPFPCRWRARQTVHPDERRIRFVHLAGPAKGMWVEWRIEPENGGTRAEIEHVFRPPIPLAGYVYGDLLVGPLFVRAVAGRTLATMKSLAERNP